MTTRTVLAVDLGRTGCRATLWTGADATSADGAGSAGLTAANGAAVTADAVLAVARPLLARRNLETLDAIGVGAAGVFAAPAAARALAERLRDVLHARGVAVASDAITSHAGAFAGGPGVVLAAGTGAIVTAIGPGPIFHRVDGWGPWLGDEGSGAWLGLAGLRAAARASDGRGDATRLTDAAWSRFGSPDALAHALAADPNPAGTAAAFAPVVAQLAGEGDVVARTLMQTAAEALAQSIQAGVVALATAVRAPVPVALLGGLLAMGDILMAPLRTAVERSGAPVCWCTPAGTSIDGARQLAMLAGGLHEPWIIRAGDAPAAATPESSSSSSSEQKA